METPRPELLGTRYERAFAYLLDLAIVLVLGALLVAIFSPVVGVILGLLLGLLLHPALMARAGAHNGQSPGRQAVGLRVVRDDGAPLTLRQAVVRDGLLKYVVLGPLLAVVGGLASLGREDRKSLQDRVAGTFVARSEERWVSPPTEVIPPPSAPADTEPEFSVRA